MVVLWLDGDAAAPPLTARIAGVGSLSVPAALATVSGIAFAGAVIVGAIAVSGGWG